MKLSEYNTKVKLKVDLTKYHQSLRIGVKGVTIGRQCMWSRNQDRFITVKFPKYTLDVLWDGLEIIDEEYLNELKEYEKREKEKLKIAKDVELVVSKRSALKYISYETKYDNIPLHTSNGFRKSIIELIKIFSENNILIKIKILDEEDIPKERVEQIKNRVKERYRLSNLIL